jgi:hypothetical protein
MKYFALFLLLAGLSACASSKADRTPSSIVFSRAGGFSGLEERYTLSESGRMQKIMKFPGRDETLTADTIMQGPMVDTIFRYLERNFDSLRAISHNETGNMTTTLSLTFNNQTHLIRWPNLEPPVLPTKKLDTLYTLVSPVQTWLSPQ